jgi:hypothetical protein
MTTHDPPAAHGVKAIAAGAPHEAQFDPTHEHASGPVATGSDRLKDEPK